jgi:hypothetical protein
MAAGTIHGLIGKRHTQPYATSALASAVFVSVLVMEVNP